MIIEYNRTGSLPEALDLLARKTPRTVPLGGGTYLSQHTQDDLAVVDLQDLDLDQIASEGTDLVVGACVRLQDLYEHPLTLDAVKKSLLNEGGLNYRNQATIAGTLVGCDGRSAFATALLAMNAHFTWIPSEMKVSLGDYFALRKTWARNEIIQSVVIPNNCRLAFELVARSPLDRPILCVAVCQWSSGRTRVALGGYGDTPIMVMDGPEPAGAEQAAQNAYRHAGDQWASAEYRSQTAGALARQMVSPQVGGQKWT